MKTGRMEAFSDGVIAVIITIMVLELKPPREATPAALLALAPALFVYGLSFLVVAILWVNHHHFVHAARQASARLLWANNNLLFWMSLIPFVTAWLSEHPWDPLPVAAYGLALAMTSISFLLLQWVLAAQNRAEQHHWMLFCRIRMKAMAALAAYLVAGALAWRLPAASYAVYVLIAAAYFLPERRLAEVAQAD